MRPTHGINFLASYTLRPRHRPRVGPEHRRRAAAGAAGDDRRRGIDRAGAGAREGRRAVRRPPPLRRQLRRASCRRRRSMGAVVEHVARRLAAQRHRPGADRLPAHRHRPVTRHPLPDQPAGRDLRSERRTRRTPSSSGSTPLLRRAAPVADDRRRVRATPAATPSAAPASRAPTCRSSRTSTLRAATRIQLRVEAFNLFNQARFGQPGDAIGTANFGRITSAEDGRVMQLGGEVQFLGASQARARSWKARLASHESTGARQMLQVDELTADG